MPIETPFRLKESITWRLKAIMIAIAFFFLISALGVYLSSLSFFSSLRELHKTNQLLSSSSLVFNNLDTSEMIIESIKTSEELNLIEEDFNKTILRLKENITKSFGVQIKSERIKEKVEAGLTLIKLYEREVRKILGHAKTLHPPLSKSEIVDIQDRILKSNTLVREAKSVLRTATAEMRKDSEIIFLRIYQNRFKPLYIAIALSASFFLFVIIFGFSLSKKISMSVQNLIFAADKVHHGDYSYSAPILSQDEFGHLTDTFNKMVRSVDDGRKRLLQLQSITAEFAFALTSDEILDITINHGFKESGASLGAIALINDEGILSFAKIEGVSEENRPIWNRYQERIHFIMEEAIRTKEPIFFESVFDAEKKFPGLTDEKIPSQYSYAYLPLIIGQDVLGVCLITYRNGKKFTQTEKDFLISIARQCAQALSRSFLYDDTKEAIRVRDEFLSIASHELKTPLTPLKLQLQILLRQLKGGADFDEQKILKTMEKSDKQLSRLSWLIDDLLDVSRISSGRLRLEFEDVNLSELIKDILSQYRYQLEHSLKFIKLDIEPNVICEVDRFRIEQVLVNLLTNAAKYAPGKPISLSLKKHRDFVEIRVTDQGPGIEEGDVDRIFNRFERVTNNNDNIGGLGLGLYICKQIVQGHEGRIYLDPKIKDGASFVVELPLGPVENRGKNRVLKES